MTMHLRIVQFDLVVSVKSEMCVRQSDLEVMVVILKVRRGHLTIQGIFQPSFA